MHIIASPNLSQIGNESFVSEFLLFLISLYSCLTLLQLPFFLVVVSSPTREILVLRPAEIESTTPLLPSTSSLTPSLLPTIPAGKFICSGAHNAPITDMDVSQETPHIVTACQEDSKSR